MRYKNIHLHAATKDTSKGGDGGMTPEAKNKLYEEVDRIMEKVHKEEQAGNYEKARQLRADYRKARAEVDRKVNDASSQGVRNVNGLVASINSHRISEMREGNEFEKEKIRAAANFLQTLINQLVRALDSV